MPAAAASPRTRVPELRVVPPVWPLATLRVVAPVPFCSTLPSPLMANPSVCVPLPLASTTPPADVTTPSVIRCDPEPARLRVDPAPMETAEAPSHSIRLVMLRVALLRLRLALLAVKVSLLPSTVAGSTVLKVPMVTSAVLPLIAKVPSAARSVPRSNEPPSLMVIPPPPFRMSRVPARV